MAQEPVRVAVVQAASVAFDLTATLQRVEVLAKEAAAGGARLVLFPEAFVSGYPRGMDFGAVIGERTTLGREWYRRYFESSIDVMATPAVSSARSHEIPSPRTS